MSSLCICGVDFSGIERNPYCQIHGENGSKSKPVSLNCDADHCTPEERAVIALAEQYHELNLMQGGTRRTLSELREAVGVVLAARAGKETG